MTLEIQGLRKRYGKIVALDGVDLRVEAGQIWGLVGGNGAGKSTLIKIVAGLCRADGGEVLLDGKPVDRARLGYAAERPALYPRWTVRENLSFFADVRGVPMTVPALGLEALLERPVGELSRGQLQRAALAVALLGDPWLLLLDEPHGGLDLGLLDALAELVRAHAARGGAVVMASHVLAEVADSCTHVAILCDGRVRAAGPLAELARKAPLDRVYRNLTEAA